MISSAAFFRENSLIIAFCAFGNLQIRNVKQNRFKNQSSDTLKLLGQNYNQQRGFIKQKIVTRFGFNVKFRKTITLTAVSGKHYQ